MYILLIFYFHEALHQMLRDPSTYKALGALSIASTCRSILCGALDEALRDPSMYSWSAQYSVDMSFNIVWSA
jgi:hypothetical protein